PSPLLSSPLFPYTTLFRSVIHLADFLQDPFAAFLGGRNLYLAQRDGRIAPDLNRNAFGFLQPNQVLPELVQNVKCGQRIQEHSRSEEHTSELQSLRHLVCR